MSWPALLPLAVLVSAIALDRLLGEPPNRWHPLSAFGKLAARIESVLRRRAAGQVTQRFLGLAALLLVIAPFAVAAFALARIPVLGVLFEIVVLYFVIAPRSLEQHALRVASALEAGRIDTAREAVGMIVSRDTAAMTGTDVARAGVESVLENGNDAVFGALFWFMVLGAPGALAYRLANTLDAMWGYKNEAYRYFGWAAARLDDALNLVPARLTALTYSLLGNTGAGLRCWRSQGPTWYSPNAGPVMAAGAGALEVTLGGPAVYEDKLEPRPDLGCGRAPEAHDIARALDLMYKGIAAWVAVFAAISFAAALS
jgi:adenosylcobinamide-phosphate synthase